ncbi:MAG TPA: hypothetical protein VG986_10485 [Pseudolabrys sp.]|nr:hypothetical protein [Pseudolabrys sp.]
MFIIMPIVAARSPASVFRRRLLAGETRVGTFIKTPTGHATEILGGVGMDFVIIDQEHAPFDRGATDLALLAAHASNIAGIVRVSDRAPSKLLAALDDGAFGVLVPHILSPPESTRHRRRMSLPLRQARIFQYQSRRRRWRHRNLRSPCGAGPEHRNDRHD